LESQHPAFFIVAPTLVFLGIFLDARKHDWLQRTFCRRIAFLSGASVEIVRSGGFDASRTCFFMSNHVNLFDPFMLYCAIPQFVRGMGAGISLQDSRLRLADEALR